MLDVLRRHLGRHPADRRTSCPGQRRPHGEGKQPIGFLDPLLYGGVGAADYTDIVPKHYGSAPKTFGGAEVGVSGPVFKSAGDLQDNQLWQVPVAGYPTTTGYDATTGWGTPTAPAFVSALAVMP